MSNERNRNLVVRLADAELEMAHALAADEGEPVSVLIRRMIRQRHVARFGDVPPATATGRSARAAKAGGRVRA